MYRYVFKLFRVFSCIFVYFRLYILIISKSLSRIHLNLLSLQILIKPVYFSENATAMNLIYKNFYLTHQIIYCKILLNQKLIIFIVNIKYYSMFNIILNIILKYYLFSNIIYCQTL